MGGNALKLYMIDDDVDDQEIFMMALDDVNKDVTCRLANNCPDAIHTLNNDTGFIPDYIFLDINMPKMSGLQCLPEIKKMDHLKDAKIIMYSTTRDKNMMEKSKELGATDFLVKPTGIAELSRSLARILDA